MKPRTTNYHVRPGIRAWLGLLVVIGSAAVPVAVGRPPIDPLPLPVYSFDAASPWIVSATGAAADGLLRGPNSPIVVITHPTLGANTLADDLDGISAANALVGMNDTFAVLFSVDRQTLGLLPPDQELLAAGIPFNVADQARRGQAAGDQFMSTQLFTRSGPLPYTRATMNAVTVRNNFDEGGTDFMAQPSTSAQDNVSGARVAQDNVDAAARLQPLDPNSPNGPFVNVYFSLTAGSPSLATLPGGFPPSGANIYFNPQPGLASTMPYASFDALGLGQLDDIDAMIVFDTNQNGVYDAGDQVIFTLTPNSPSLYTIPGTSQTARGADLFTAFPGQGPQLFAAAAMLGLGAPPDNIDALDLLPCTNGMACALLHGIRSFPGDLNCDHVISYADINPFVVALSSQSAYQARYPDCNWYNADCNGDRVVSYADINPFVQLLAGGPL
jgi:hypothetical protein